MGDPSGQVPDFVKEALAEAPPASAIIPPSPAREDWRQAASGWLNRRFGLNGAIDAGTACAAAERHPRRACSRCCFPSCRETKAGARPIVAMPNPFYQCYAAAALGSRRRAALCAGAEGERLPARFRRPARSDAGADGSGLYLLAFQSRRRGGRAALIGRTLFALAERHDFIVLADECYADIWFDRPPAVRPARAACPIGRLHPSFDDSIRCPSARACRDCALAWWRATPS